jgi:small-conductance mechanosensitive channel
MKCLCIEFTHPTLLRTFWLLLHCVIVILILYGVRISIEDGSLTNKPELLRQLLFWALSLALAIRIARDCGVSRNSFAKKLLMIFIIYIPTALILAVIAGVI